METNHLFSLQVGNNRVWDYVRDNYVHRLLQSEGDGKVCYFFFLFCILHKKEKKRINK